MAKIPSLASPEPGDFLRKDDGDMYIVIRRYRRGYGSQHGVLYVDTIDCEVISKGVRVRNRHLSVDRLGLHFTCAPPPDEPIEYPDQFAARDMTAFYKTFGRRKNG